MSTTKVLALVGSLRNGSTNAALAEAVVAVAPEHIEVDIYDGLAEIPFYNEDIDVPGQVPDAAARLRAAVADADSLLLVSPEYNGSAPAVLKNAIDWISRPFGQGAAAGKPAAVIGTAFGQFGGVWAHDEARKSLGIAGANVLDAAKLSVANSVVRFAELHPKDDAEVAGQVVKVLEALAGTASTEGAAA
ncbi:NAD(P)H-dependent oxidoreductase [Specibacter cremeus]|uniref:NAD(P)H-dependent oxidoreductase n=1 Tax=Specibacter cremeus TaxID=1629051 RepID=UPI000F78B30A|nr:NAD(P)H-dependent oxidoreductase [Specibacter cremeus]